MPINLLADDTQQPINLLADDMSRPQLSPEETAKEKARKKIMDLNQNGIFDRPRQRLSEDALSLAKNIGSTVSSGIPSALNQLSSDPTKLAKNVGAGLAGIPVNIANTVMNLPAYLAHLESNKLSGAIKQYTPQIPKEKIQNYIAGEPTQQDIDVRGLTELSPLGIPIAKGAIPAAKATGKVAGAVSNKLTFNMLPGKHDPLLEANEIQLELRGKDKASEFDKATEAYAQSEAAQKAAQSQAKQELGKSDPDLMAYNVNKKQQEIENISNEANTLKEQLSQVKPEETALPQAEANLSKADLAHQNAQGMFQDVESNIGRHLNEGAAHDVRAAAGLDSRVQSIENYWNDSYKKFHNDIKDAKFQMPQEAMDKLDYSKMSPTQLIKTFGADAFDALKKGKIEEFTKKQMAKEKGTEGNVYLDKLTEVAPTVADTNAADFLAKFKDFRDRTYRLGQKLRDPRVEEVEKQKIESALKKAREMQTQMKEVLDAGLGEYKPEFERVNKGYSEQVYPLRDNPIVEKAKEGKLPDNMIKSLRTDEPGMPLVREIVKQDPEILRNIIGQRYFSKSGKGEIHAPNETTLEYLQHMPELQKMLQHREQTGTALEQAKANAKLAKEHHAQIQASQGKATKMQSDIDNLTTKVAQYQAEIPKLQAHIDKLRETSKRKDIDLKKKIATEKELKAVRKELADIQKKSTEATTGLHKLWKIAKTVYRVGKKVI